MKNILSILSTLLIFFSCSNDRPSDHDLVSSALSFMAVVNNMDISGELPKTIECDGGKGSVQINNQGTTTDFKSVATFNDCYAQDYLCETGEYVMTNGSITTTGFYKSGDDTKITDVKMSGNISSTGLLVIDCEFDLSADEIDLNNYDDELSGTVCGVDIKYIINIDYYDIYNICTSIFVD
jgi:hypothetical protein